MTSDGGSVLGMIFSIVWQLFTSWYIPGTHVTPGMFLIFLTVAGFGLRWLISITSGASIGSNTFTMPSNIRDRAFNHESNRW